MDGFSPRLLKTKYGAPLTTVLPGAVSADSARRGARWFDIGSGWNVMTSSALGSATVPGVLGFCWVRSSGVVKLLLQDDPTALAVEFPEPNESLLGFRPLTYGRALAYEKTRGRQPVHSASCRFTDGRFMHSELASELRFYYFASANPTHGEQAIAAALRLRD